jgi:hypothetical protein
MPEPHAMRVVVNAHENISGAPPEKDTSRYGKQCGVDA